MKSALDLLPSSRLLRLCRVVRSMIALGALMLMLLPWVFWLMPSWVPAWVSQMTSLPGDAVRSTTLTPWLGTLVTLLPAGLGLAALWQLWRLFGAYAQGRALTHEAQRHLRRFAALLLALALVEPLYRAAMSVVFSLGNAPGSRQLILSLSSHDYLQVLLALVLLAIATVMGEAVRAAEENKSFV